MLDKVELERQRRRLYYLKHKEEVKAKATLYYNSHKKDITEKCRIKRLENIDSSRLKHRNDYYLHKEKRIQKVSEYYNTHREEILAKNHVKYLENKDVILLVNKNYRLKHLEQEALHHREYYKNNKERALKQIKEYRENNKDHIKMLYRVRYVTNKTKRYNRNLALKLDILKHYGNGYLACVKCGFTDIRALSIDHINGNGNKQRRELKLSSNLYYWLKKHNYPEGYQTLCMNCQFIKKLDYDEKITKTMEVELCTPLV
jgi:hypothetical protein